jgi:mono/diheme cytochrome c family protein
VKHGIILLLLTALAVLTAGSLFAWSGLYNIAAAEPHFSFTRWLLATVRDRSVLAHSQGINAPNLSDPRLFQSGFRSYHDMCRTCHGAPGEESSPIRKGLNPQPPTLDAQRVQGRSDAALYWIVKNGIRMTGMPAFGKTHGDDELWAVVSFVRQLPRIKPEEYRALIEIASSGESMPGGQQAR